jgi:two-component system, sensor histidine kinase LadS
MADGKEQVAAAIVKARENLEQALAELERLPAFDPSTVGFAAHALNNYLTITGGTIELLLSALTAHPDPQIHTWLEGLHHATTLMTHTVSRLISAAAPQDTTLRFEPVALPVLVQRLCHYYQRVADRKRLHILYSSSGEVPPVWTDRVAVGAVLDNLLSNAVKYSPLGKRIWVQVQGDRTSATCSVQDEGPGLSAEEQARLFQRGVRLSPLPTGGEPSMGYGLAVAKELIEHVGGAIWCVSTPRQGACFSFRLPAYQEPMSDPRQSSPEPYGGPETTGRTTPCS